ncbi:FapA family protein [Desulfovibrio sp. OttesenSCG-928-F07]|nr:FapA family protein [Desulfovibrio sp. OttesenSCG-928-F07]
MPYYVRHFFNPDFNHEELRPEVLHDGDVSQHYLGYVQNVVAGQVLAEVINLDEHPYLTDYDPRFIFPDKVFPCGPNCAAHPKNPSRIVATSNGYVFYNQGLITVKKLLNVRRDVDFHTGNIMFTGDIIAHGAIRTGFTVQGNRVLVKGTVEGARVVAENDIVCEAGLKGANSGFLQCNGNVKIPFCENIKIHALGNVEIEGSCMHSEIYVGGSLMIKGRLQGGTICANNIIYVTDQIGGGQNTSTKIMMGYSPAEFYELQQIEADISNAHTRLEHLERLVQKKPVLLEAYDLTIRLMREKLRLLHQKHTMLWKNFRSDEENAAKCRIICPGRIRPGVEISIARAYTDIQDFYEGLEFRLEDDEVVFKKLEK